MAKDHLDLFQRAVAAAQAEAGNGDWAEMSLSEQPGLADCGWSILRTDQPQPALWKINTKRRFRVESSQRRELRHSFVGASREVI